MELFELKFTKNKEEISLSFEIEKIYAISTVGIIEIQASEISTLRIYLGEIGTLQNSSL